MPEIYWSQHESKRDKKRSFVPLKHRLGVARRAIAEMFESAAEYWVIRGPVQHI